MNLNESLIQRLIMGRQYRQAFVLPNYTPFRWWECDVFEVTAAGYFREYEVKLNISDFKADKKKAKGMFNKHTLLEEGHIHGPSQFYYVTPKGLLFTEDGPQVNKEALLPSWAGLFEVDIRNGWLRLEHTKRAPRLHKRKLDEKVLEKARGTLYWRMHNLLETRRRIRFKKC